MHILFSPKFEKEFKKLSKKYISLDQDLETVLKFITEQPAGDGSPNWPILKHAGSKFILKKRMMCRCVRGTSFRLIYFYDGENIEIEFIEIYFKGAKTNHDQARIEKIWDEKTNS